MNKVVAAAVVAVLLFPGASLHASESMKAIAAGKAEGWKDVPDVKEAYCPMVKKSWLQKDGSIRNPYYGPAMPTCGEFKQ
jgi:hypothetical protein